MHFFTYWIKRKIFAQNYKFSIKRNFKIKVFQFSPLFSSQKLKLNSPSACRQAELLETHIGVFSVEICAFSCHFDVLEVPFFCMCVSFCFFLANFLTNFPEELFLQFFLTNFEEYLTIVSFRIGVHSFNLVLYTNSILTIEMVCQILWYCCYRTWWNCSKGYDEGMYQ